MYKSGVTNKESLLKNRNWLGREKKVAIPLVLSQLEVQPDNEAINTIFNEVLIGGTYKMTKKNRFSQINHQIISVIKRYYNTINEKISIHDLAVSNGITSIEFFDDLRATGINIDFLSSDYFTHIYIIRLKGQKWQTVLDSNFNLLQYFGYGFVLSEPESKFDVINRLLLRILNKHLLLKAQNLIRQVLTDTDEYQHVEIKTSQGDIIRVPLVHPNCINKIDTHENFLFKRHDLFSETKEKFDVIRAMNILNIGYFPEEMLKQAARSIFQSFREKGVFIVGRSHDESDGITRCSIFEKTGNQFVVIEDINGGSEIRELLLRMF